MAIHKRSKSREQDDAAAEAFLSGADSSQSTVEIYNKGIVKGKKRQFSITMSPDLLHQIDQRAEAMGMGRSAFISMAVFNELDR